MTAISAVSATVTTLPTRTYYWKLEAFDQFEWGPASPVRSFTTQTTLGGVFGRAVHAGVGILAIVGMYDGSGNLVRQVSTPDGKFAISNVSLGTYEVRVTSPTYQPRTLRGITLNLSTPVVDLGEIELVPIAAPTFDWMPIVFLGAVIGAVVVAAIGVVAVLGRRRRREAPAVSEMSGGVVAPADVTAAPEVAPETATAEGLPFECPECGTAVGADAKSCPGCGAIFE